MGKIVKLFYYAGAVAILAGAVMRLTHPDIFSYVYLAGAVAFALAQFFLRVRHPHYAVRRLVVQQQIGGLFLIASGVLMFTHRHNEWMAIMLCGALMELYTAFRIPNEIEKHK